MVAFLTQNVVDVFGVSGIKLCLIDNACSNRSCKARVATGKHCQHTAKVSHSNSPPLIPKTLTLVLLKALIRTNDNCGFLFKVTFAGNIHSLKSTNFTMATIWAGFARP